MLIVLIELHQLLKFNRALLQQAMELRSTIDNTTTNQYHRLHSGIIILHRLHKKLLDIIITCHIKILIIPFRKFAKAS